MRYVMGLVLVVLSGCATGSMPERAAMEEAKKHHRWCDSYVVLSNPGSTDILLDGCGARFAFACSERINQRTSERYFSCEKTKTYVYPRVEAR